MTTNPLKAGGKGLTLPQSDKKKTSSTVARSSPATRLSPTMTSGLPMNQVDLIAATLNEFSSRVSQIIEITSTLAQFQSIVERLHGLPQVSGLWSVKEVAMGDTEENSLVRTNDRDIPIPEGSVMASDYLEHIFGENNYPLPSLDDVTTREKTEVYKYCCVVTLIGFLIPGWTYS